MEKKELRKIRAWAVFLSYLIGLPTGLCAIVAAYVTPTAMSGEGLPFLGMVSVYGPATFVLLMCFLYALWYGAKFIPLDFIAKRNLLRTSFRYSLRVNLIIWPVFVLIVFLQTLLVVSLQTLPIPFSWMFLIPPLAAFFMSVAGTTFTIGLVICLIIKWKIKTLAQGNA